MMESKLKAGSDPYRPAVTLVTRQSVIECRTTYLAYQCLRMKPRACCSHMFQQSHLSLSILNNPDIVLQHHLINNYDIKTRCIHAFGRRLSDSL